MKLGIKRLFLSIMIFAMLTSGGVYCRGVEKLVTDTTTCPVGGKIVVEYTPKYEKDWVGIFDLGVVPGSGIQSLRWVYLDADGVTDLYLGNSITAGQYAVYVLENDGYKILAETHITVGAPALSIDKYYYSEGDTIVIEYTYENPKDWIGIYAKGQYNSDGCPSIQWAYVSESGRTEIVLGEKITPGEYAVFLYKNDGYEETGRAVFIVEGDPITKPDAPASLVYEKDTTVSAEYSDGKVIVTPSENVSAGALLYWGIDGAPLEDHTYIGFAPYSKTEGKYIYEMTKGNIIPPEANCICAFGVNGFIGDHDFTKAIISDECAYVMLDKLPEKLPEPLYSFEVMSDLHVGSYYRNMRVGMALSDIRDNMPDSRGVMVVGDLTNYGTDEEYETLGNIVSDSEIAIPIKYAIGNHAFYSRRNEDDVNSGFEESWAAFRKFSGWEDPVYYQYEKIGGDYFVFMGTEGFFEGVDTAYGYYSEQQRNWLKAILEKAESENANAFVFMHQSIDETVSGSFSSRGQAWSGINDDEEMRAVIESYENTFLFTGHSHWNLHSYGPFINGGTTGASYFNTASAGYLWSDSNKEVEGSEGLHVDVYDNFVIVKGREYMSQKWIPNVYVKIMSKSSECAVTGGKPYDYLEQAIEACTDGKITLSRDVTLRKTVTIPENTVVECGDNTITDGKLKLSNGASVVANNNIYDHITADGNVKVSFNNGVYTFTSSDILSDAIGVEGVQIRTEKNRAIRFIFSISKSLYETIEKPLSYEDIGTGFGSVVLPDKLLGEESLTKNNLVTDAYGRNIASAIVPAVNIFDEDDKKVYFTVCLTDIPDALYKAKYSARPYVTTADGTVYGEEISTSLFDVAVLCYNDEEASEEIKQQVYDSILSVADPENYPENN